jgi:alkylation response protein AidB-like acyl-CoA dehydrogenase
MIDLSFGPEIEAFRAELGEVLRASLPDDIRRLVAAERMDLPREMQQRWHKILHARGWSCPAWPKEHGGTGWSDAQHYVFEREVALADAPRPMLYGVSMLGPTIIAYGTEAQQRRFLPGIVAGDIFWCQGFSEPNAGSDLASLACRAVRDGDHYVIDGTKIWTSEAHIADWMFGLFRTDTSGKKQHGITFLMLDLKSSGVTVRPLITFEGNHEVNQVFFEGVRVPVDQRLGEEHQGWAVAKYLLGLERFGTAEVSRSLASLGRLKALAAAAPPGGRPLLDDPRFAQAVAEAEMALRAVEVTELRFLFGPGGADALGAEASMLKIRGTEVQQRILELTHQALGPYAVADGLAADDGTDRRPPFAPPAAAHAARAHFNFRKTAIYSGSNEIQKNIIAKAVLGL